MDNSFGSLLSRCRARRHSGNITQKNRGAGNGNRTRLSGLPVRRRPERATGIEPASSAWKANIITVIRRPHALAGGEG